MSKDIVSAIKKCLPDRRPIYHHEPFIETRKTQAVLERCVSLGATEHYFIDMFRDKIAEITGADGLVPTSSGTAALHIALLACGVQPKDEILVPSVTYAATVNAVLDAKAIPHFIEGSVLRPHKLNWYLERCEKGRFKAVIPVHLVGNPLDIVGICQVAKKHGLKVIEDAAQALGSTIDGRHCGTFGDAGILSFNNNKIITTNGGGMILSNDPWVAAKAHQLATIGRIPHDWLIEHDAIGWNYHMGNINAALGCAQLDEFENILDKKRWLAKRYRDELKGLVEFLDPAEGSTSNYWLNTILVKDRDEVLRQLHYEGIKARALYTPLHRLPMYKHFQRSDNVMYEADNLFNRAVCLPSGANL